MRVFSAFSSAQDSFFVYFFIAVSSKFQVTRSEFLADSCESASLPVFCFPRLPVPVENFPSYPLSS